MTIKKLSQKNQNDFDAYLVENNITTMTTEQYLYCVDVLFGNNHVANWSDAGTGKSWCLEIIKGFAGDECIICATTGSANSNLFDGHGGNGTAHSVLSLPLGIHNSKDESSISEKTRNILLKTDLVKLIIVEEAGTLNPDQLMLIMKRIMRANKPYGSKRKSRNIRLVLQGDLLQCTPIITKEEEIEYIFEKYEDVFLPESTVYKEMNFKSHVFTEVKRTKEKVFSELLKVVRYGQVKRYNKLLKYINDICYAVPPKGIPIIATTNKRVNEENSKGLKRNENPLHALDAIISGDFDMSDCQADERILVKVGSPVLILANDKDGAYSNGSYGHISHISGESIGIKLSPSRKTVTIERFKYENREYLAGSDEMEQRVIGKCLQFPLKLAHALSVHRVQGKTLSTPYILDLGWGFPESQNMDWGKQLAYVGISRATGINNIYLSQPLTAKHIKCNMRARDWVVKIAKQNLEEIKNSKES